jgi:ferredoxin-NADP reductase
MNAKIIDIEKNTKTTKIFTLKLENKFEFVSGQFIKLIISNFDLIRPYSISSPGGKTDEITLTIKVYNDGTFTKEVDNLKIGDTVKIEGPYGMFTFDGNTNKNIVLIAGGSGISTLHSILRFILDNNYKNNVKLLYSSKTPEEIIYKKEIETLAEKYTNFDALLTITNKVDSWKGHKGRLTNAELDVHIEDKDSLIYICGPVGFVNFIVEELNEIGVSEENIKIERYGKEI